MLVLASHRTLLCCVVLHCVESVCFLCLVLVVSCREGLLCLLYACVVSYCAVLVYCYVTFPSRVIG